MTKFILALTALVAGLYLLNDYREQVAVMDSIATRGVEVRSDPLAAYSKTRGLRGGTTYHLPLTFETRDGRSIRVYKEVSYATIKKFVPDTRIRLRYLPSDPTQIVVVGDEDTGSRFNLWLGVLCILLAGWWCLGIFADAEERRHPHLKDMRPTRTGTRIPAKLLGRLEPVWQQPLQIKPRELLMQSTTGTLMRLLQGMSLAIGTERGVRPEDFKNLPPIYRHTHSLIDFFAAFRFSKWSAVHGFGEARMQPVIEALRYYGIEEAAAGFEVAVLRIPAIPVAKAGPGIDEGFASIVTARRASDILSEAFKSKCPYGFDEIQQRMARFVRDNPHEFLV